MSSGSNIVFIYKITNIVNNKCYIGSTNKLNRRWNFHISCLNNNKHHSYHLQKSWIKYGSNNFVFEEIACCNLINRDYLESFYIDYFKSSNRQNGYNLRISATNLSQESIEKIRLGHIGKIVSFTSIQKTIATRKANSDVWHSKETKQKIGNAHKGKIVSDKTKKIQSKALKNRWQNPIYQEHFCKAALNGRIAQSKSVLQYDLNNNLLNEFSSIKQAEKELFLSSRAVAKSIKHGYKVKKQFYFKLK